MRFIAALLLLQGAVLYAQDAPPADPLVAQRRLAALLRQATAAYERGNYQGAVDVLAGLSGSFANDLSVLNLRAAALTKIGRHEEAMKIFSGILEVKPDYFPAAFNLAEVRLLAGDREGALEAFRQLRRRDPRNELLRFKVFLCLATLGRDEEAAKVSRAMSAAGLTPSWYYAQAVVARRSGDEAKAREHLRAARAIYGDQGCLIYDEALETAGP
jgi:Flp pilus assembly protein TadD